ncbi:hypothetical protein M8C21_020409, partial [Ambrosia artemisiifolia]
IRNLHTETRNLHTKFDQQATILTSISDKLGIKPPPSPLPQPSPNPTPKPTQATTPTPKVPPPLPQPSLKPTPKPTQAPTPTPKVPPPTGSVIVPSSPNTPPTVPATPPPQPRTKPVTPPSRTIPTLAHNAIVRIKKIMQADEDVGKMAMAVPLLVSKALELFLQDLCDRTYKITLQRGAKTLNSKHLKQCVQSFTLFDFLRDIVGKVPDRDVSDAAGEDRSATKRRKVADGDEKPKREKPVEFYWPESGRVTGMCRSSGKFIPAGTGVDTTAFGYVKHETKPDITDEQKPKAPLDLFEDAESKLNLIPVEKTEDTVKVRNFDLNLDLDENGDTPMGLSTKPTSETKPEEYRGWSLMGVEKMAIDPVKVANLRNSVDEDEEDYDEE